MRKKKFVSRCGRNALQQNKMISSSYEWTMSSDWNKKKMRTGREDKRRTTGGKIIEMERMVFIENVKQVCVRIYVFVLVSFRICTQNVRMIYFHIWFVCASSPNIIHIKWNFFFCVCTSDIQLCLADPFFSPRATLQWKRLQFFQVHILIQCVFFFVSSHWSCLTLRTSCPSVCLARSSINIATTRTTNIRQKKYRYFSIYLRLQSHSLVMFLR